MRLLRTAILRGHRPTTHLHRVQPGSKWNHLDYVLAEAYQIYEDERGNNGMPMWITRSGDPEIMFTVDTFEDRAAAAIQDWEEKHSKDKKKGIVPYVLALTTEGTPFEYGGITRQRFSEAAIQEEQDREEGLDIDRQRPEGGYDPSEYGDGDQPAE